MCQRLIQTVDVLDLSFNFAQLLNDISRLGCELAEQEFQLIEPPVGVRIDAAGCIVTARSRRAVPRPVRSGIARVQPVRRPVAAH